MKISKLFHWLYASLMLAPVFAVGVTCLTHVFNKETGIVEVSKYETIDNTYVIDIDTDLEELNLYGRYVRATNVYFSDSYTTCFNLYFNSNKSYFYNFRDIDNNIWIYCSISSLDFENWTNHLKFYNDIDGEYMDFIDFSPDEIQYFDFLIPSYEWFVDYFGSNLGEMTLSPVPYEDIPKMSVSSNEENIFYYSIDRLKESPYFNWAYNSFLFGPIGSITNIFSLPQNNIVSMLLSYWLALSVIWLVFDLIMYIPLLVHKWIDKAMIE